jgi:hypothetical protein
MSVTEKYRVEKIPPDLAHPFIKEGHYAHRLPMIIHAFGLYEGQTLKGVCTFGRPFAQLLIDRSFQGKYTDHFLELNRLYVVDGVEKNTLSFFVSRVLKMLPRPMVVVSYADTKMNHYGFIYQALNFHYTGLSAPRKDPFIKGMEAKHNATIFDLLGRGRKNRPALMRKQFGDRFYYKERSRKHRYFYFLGSKKEVKEMKALCIYPFLPYPKGEPTKYETKKKIPVLQRLV